MSEQDGSTLIFDNLVVKIAEDSKTVGVWSADFVAKEIANALESKDKARVIFATGASQFNFIEALIGHDVDWKRVEAFHLDEYVGLDEQHPASFRRYLRERLFDKVNPAQVHYLDGDTNDPEGECQRYTELLMADEIDLACIGIGENGHIAFNDPPVADFDDEKWVKVVELDEACRKQQYGEGWFESLEAVPTHALTQTIPSIMRSKIISCVVPDERKAPAVKSALHGPIQTACPASILRSHDHAVLWLDQAAASLIQ